MTFFGFWYFAVLSFVVVQVLTPSARPNWSMLMIDSDVLLTTITRDLCSRLQAASLIPMDCPILVVKVSELLTVMGSLSRPSFANYELQPIPLNYIYCRKRLFANPPSVAGDIR